jgi:hypothetical protein
LEEISDNEQMRLIGVRADWQMGNNWWLMGQPIPWVENRHYDKQYRASAWLESQGDRGFGLAVQKSEIDDIEDPVIRDAGIDGDAQAIAVSFRTYGERWYAALVVVWLDNIETTDQNKYVNARGTELYLQWDFGH